MKNFLKYTWAIMTFVLLLGCSQSGSVSKPKIATHYTHSFETYDGKMYEISLPAKFTQEQVTDTINDFKIKKILADTDQMLQHFAQKRVTKIPTKSVVTRFKKLKYNGSLIADEDVFVMRHLCYEIESLPASSFLMNSSSRMGYMNADSLESKGLDFRWKPRFKFFLSEPKLAKFRSSEIKRACKDFLRKANNPRLWK